MDYYDFGTPISFGGVLDFLKGKTVTRRDWKDSHANKFINAWNRAVTANRILRVPAINKAYHAGGQQIGWLTFPEPPYKQALKNMRQSELIEEGGMCATKEEFISKYFKGDKEKEVWVVQFKLYLFDSNHSNHEQNQKCVHSICSPVSAELGSLSNQLVDLKLPKLSKYPQPQERFTTIISPPQSTTTSEPSREHKISSIVLSEEAHARICRDVEKKPVLTEADGGLVKTPPSKPASKKKKAKKAIAEPASLTTALLASPNKPTLWPSESNTSKNSTKSSALEVLTSSKSDEYHTPVWLIEAARKALGGQIDLDPMSNSRANQTVRARRFFTKEENALSLKWEGKIWMNPAFSIADEAVDKIISEYELGNILEAVVLLKSAPETKRYQKMYPHPFCELNKRVSFDAESNKSGAPFATTIFYMGPNFARFQAAFEPYGRVHIGGRLTNELLNAKISADLAVFRSNCLLDITVKLVEAGFSLSRVSPCVFFEDPSGHRISDLVLAIDCLILQGQDSVSAVLSSGHLFSKKVGQKRQKYEEADLYVALQQIRVAGWQEWLATEITDVIGGYQTLFSNVEVVNDKN